jgi:hypothetical protein
MEKAKAAVSEFMHKAGHHDTTVHEKVAPAVVNETIIKKRHEEAQTAIDREIHQDHYHTTIQPVKDREVLPEKHVSQIVGVETREHVHGDAAAVKARLEEERRQFQSTTRTATQETHSVAPVIAGEHVHHHVHETIQPILEKEIIQPQVIHTTVPIHEIHHNEPKHHAASALPPVSLADFKKQGGTLAGREERFDGFEGEPKAVSSTLGASTTGTHATTGPHSSRLENKLDPRVDSDGDGSRNLGAASSGYGTGTSTGGHGRSSTDGTAKKPSLLDRLNPMKDTDGDGKKGVME